MSSVRLDEKTEYILGCIGRVRILNLLSERGGMNISKIVDLTGLNHKSVDSHLAVLMEAGLVEDKRYGRQRFIRPCFSRLCIVFEAGNPVKVEITNQ